MGKLDFASNKYSFSQVSHINGRKLVLNKKEVPELVLNKDAIMQDFAILGTDIVNLVDDLKN